MPAIAHLHQTKIAVAPSELGYIALRYAEDGVLACTFGHASEVAAVRALEQRIEQSVATPTSSTSHEEPQASELMARLVRYAAGECADFSDVSLHGAQQTPFQCRVIAACRKIPWGQTRTYGQLACAAGSPAAARAVGRVMATNRVPLVVPCHRVVPASGGLGGFSAPQGVSMKRRLLRLESDVHAS